MTAEGVLKNARALAARLRMLHQRRKKRRAERGSPGSSRRSLKPKERAEVLAKTAGRCHICGGQIEEDEGWSADHVLAHAHGGTHDVANYLPAHALCNTYRWHYGPEELQWILKLGVWFRSRIADGDPLASELAEAFVRYEARRHARRASSD